MYAFVMSDLSFSNFKIASLSNRVILFSTPPAAGRLFTCLSIQYVTISPDSPWLS